MIFIGDIAVPQNITPRIDHLPVCFAEQPVVANLEGAVVQNTSSLIKKRKLYNSTNVLPFLDKMHIKVVSLGNNHITDEKQAFEFTCSCLDACGITYCGAGVTTEAAAKPAILSDNNNIYAFLSFGWSVVSCNYVSEGELGVNPLEEPTVLDCIAETRKSYPTAKIILLPHWNYELEKYPMPMHRDLAMRAIDAGVDAIFGHHPHCVQGIEFYKEKPIVYSLGNWFIPHGIYMNGKVKFPTYAHLQLAVEWNDGRLFCHWFEFKPNNQQLCYAGSEDALISDRIKKLTPYANMDTMSYYKWFCRNRIKKKMLPVFRSSNYIMENKMKSTWVKIRQAGVNFLFDSNIKNGRSGVR